MEQIYREYVKSTRISVGVDLHKKHWAVTIMDRSELVKKYHIPGTWEALKKTLIPYAPAEVTVCYEAGYFGYWLHDEVEKWGGQCAVIAPSLIPQASGNRVKTDPKDSFKLAHLLSKELLKPIYVPAADKRAERQLLRTRTDFVEDRHRVQCRIKSFLTLNGIEAPEDRDWSVAFVEKLKSLRMPHPLEHYCLAAYLKQYEDLKELIKGVDQQLRQLAKSERYQNSVALLKSAPGIGTLTAMEFLLEIEDIHRFTSGERLAAYIGLTPSQYSSGEHTRLGRITKGGKSHLRGTLVEAAWSAIRQDQNLKTKYERIKMRAGAKRAIVAIARNVVVRLRVLLLTQQKYQYPEEPNTLNDAA